MADQQVAQPEAGPRPIIPILKLQPKPHLVGIKCGSCGALFLDLKRMACSKCGAADGLSQVALSDRGKVWVFSVVHQSFPGIKTPYVTAIVDLPEGISVKSNLIDIDPEDLQAHYNMMLSYRGLNQNENAEREEKLFLRFKADEASQSITEKPRLLNPEENNERQPIHDHATQ